MAIVKNAIIENARIEIERGFILTAWLQLNYGGMVQGFGGFSLFLDKTSSNHEQAKEKNYAGIFISRVLEIADVESWDDLSGKTIRVEKDSEMGSILKIGHIVKDDWFDPKIEMEIKKTKSIELTAAEIQSGSTRVDWAEGLIKQLPENHEGRNSWLLNYGRKNEN